MTHVTRTSFIDVYTRARARAYTVIMGGSVTCVTLWEQGSTAALCPLGRDGRRSRLNNKGTTAARMVARRWCQPGVPEGPPSRRYYAAHRPQGCAP